MVALLCLSAVSFSGCAVIFGGPITQHQATAPMPGQPPRQIRWVAFAADLLIFFPSLGVDFATNAIYMPHTNKARIVTKMK